VQIFQHFQTRFRGKKKEYVIALLLDGKNRVIREVPISEGSLNQSIVHPREVFNPAVRDSAAAIILVHNHPTGDPSPSREDLELTRRLKEAGELMGIRVLDHLIIGDVSYVSLADRGML
jgi:DNA repair protein RadC